MMRVGNVLVASLTCTAAAVAGTLQNTGAHGDVYDICNGETDGVNGLSNATAGVFGFRRTVLDDFEVTGGSEFVRSLEWRSVWGTPMGGAMGTDLEFSIRTDVAGTPGAVISTAQFVSYSETPTGNILFSREEVLHFATFEAGLAAPGRYWFEAAVVGPENNFWLARETVSGSECWVNYEDFGGLQPVSDWAGTRYDLGWSMVAFNSQDVPGACCLDDASCLDDLIGCDCVALGGRPRGGRTTCVETACPPFGACCLEDGTCTEEFVARDCTAAGGEFGGLGRGCVEFTCTPPCVADLDGSGAVDLADILRILGAWGQMQVPEDLDGSGIVDFGDILVVLGAWGPC